jgi:transposase
MRSNATSESLNRLAKLEARLAYGFRNPLNQRRRVRIACTRGNRRHGRRGCGCGRRGSAASRSRA